MLYHLTTPDALDEILETGLRPRDNSDAVDPLLVAEETRDRLLDRYGRETFGSEYPSRRQSVFFYTDPVFAATEAEESGAAAVAVEVEAVEAAPIFSANRMRVEDLFDDIKQGILAGSVTNPAYDREDIEQRARDIVEEDFQPWAGGADANREVWVARRIPPKDIREWT